MISMRHASVSESDAPEFIAADVALFGATDATNPWRNPYIETLVALGVDPNTIYNPLITGRPWDPAIDGPHEKFQKENARFVVLYLGRTVTNSLGAYSSFEAPILMQKRPADSTIVVLDGTALSVHPGKTITQMKSDLQDAYPGTPVADSLGESLAWITEKLQIRAALGDLALKTTAEQINDRHKKTLQGVTPEYLKALEQAQVIEAAQPFIEQIQTMMLDNPSSSWFRLDRIDYLKDESERKAIVDAVTKYFTALGWKIEPDYYGVPTIMANNRNTRAKFKGMVWSQQMDAMRH